MSDVNNRSAHTGGWRPAAGRPKNFDANVQDIASAAHVRGVVLLRAETVVGSVEAAELCRTLRAAHENTRGQDGRHDHVERLANGIAVKLAVRGAVQVSATVMNFLRGYAAAQRPRTSKAAGAGACNQARKPAQRRKDTGA